MVRGVGDLLKRAICGRLTVKKDRSNNGDYKFVNNSRQRTNQWKGPLQIKEEEGRLVACHRPDKTSAGILRDALVEVSSGWLTRRGEGILFV